MKLCENQLEYNQSFQITLQRESSRKNSSDKRVPIQQNGQRKPLRGDFLPLKIWNEGNNSPVPDIETILCYREFF